MCFCTIFFVAWISEETARQGQESEGKAWINVSVIASRKKAAVFSCVSNAERKQQLSSVSVGMVSSKKCIKFPLFKSSFMPDNKTFHVLRSELHKTLRNLIYCYNLWLLTALYVRLVFRISCTFNCISCKVSFQTKSIFLFVVLISCMHWECSVCLAV